MAKTIFAVGNSTIGEAIITTDSGASTLTVDNIAGDVTGQVSASSGFSTQAPLVITANTTLTAADSGRLVFCNAADLVVTLPSTSAGLNYTVVTNVASASTGTSISPAAADQIVGLGITPADNKDLINTGATDAVGDFVKITGDGSVGWYTGEYTGTWEREA